MFAAKESSSKVAKTDIDARHPDLPSISLPKGGGAIRGIGEKFTSNPVTGTGSLSVPIYTSPGRSGFGPQLSLSYDSGAGNGPVGLGWNLSLPSIMRKTDKGLPLYQDDNESDTFILSGVEDLIPVLVQVDGQWQRDTTMRTLNGVGYRIQRYRPRVEGLFARIERWTNLQTGEIHWRSISRGNITTMYGKTAESRIADPDDPQRVFSWLICESYDDKGNAILYEYKAENSQGIDLSLVHERNLTDATRAANRYLKRIKYGNKTPYKLGEDLTARNDWMFEVVFDYSEHYSEDNQGQPTTVFLKNEQRHWKVRLDPFSSFRAGFEIRTYRLCRRVLMFHHFPDELSADDYLVRSTDFTYVESSIASFITSITQSGYVRRKDGKYLKKSLPPLEFGYSQATIQNEIQEIDADSLKDLPSGLDGTRYQWVDLDGEGISGIITEQEGALFYKRNLSSVPVLAADGKPTLLARFAPVEQVATVPSLTNLRGGRQQLIDLAGDGQLDLVHFDAPLSGYFERTLDEKWESFIQFASVPNVPWHDPNLKFVDLTGDGHADILITEDEAFTWYLSLAERGFAEGKKARQALDDEKGPRLFFADATESIYLADMSGDGMVDLVRIRNGEVCYWPNLGYGRFGAKVTMDNAPWFDTTDQFDQRRIRLADIDGSGVTDIIYIGHDGVRLYFNQSGNSWSDARTLTQFPQTDNLSLVMVVDLLGNGTACLVWWSPLPRDAPRPIRYVDLMGGQKPHLLVSVKNNMGAETRVQYASSTKFYLMDKAAGKPWITRLPFPVHVVERVETYDWISRNRFVIRYAYHHGYFDGIEREFRGFGLIEQWDTEEFAVLSASSAFPSATNIEEASYVHPVLTKTWFHTGAYFGGSLISRHFENEYYREPGLTDAQFRAQLLLDTILPGGLTAEEELEACRALKGSILRQEIYGLDGSPQSKCPYSVSERNYAIKLIQPQEVNHHAVFFVHPRETIDYHYERNPTDPRISHSLTLAVDAFGNVLRSAAVGYGRVQPDHTLSAQDQAKQIQTSITCTENRFTNPIELADAYRTPLPCESRTYELTGLAPNEIGRFDLATMDQAVITATPLAYEVTPAGSLQKRLIEHVRTLYRKDDLTGSLPLGQIESLGLLFERYQLAFTLGLVTQVYGNRVADAMLSNEGGYVHLAGDTNWWIPSGQIFFSPNAEDTPAQELNFARQHFFLAHRFQDPFGNNFTLTYDKYVFLLQKTRDPLGNIITVETKDDQGNDLIALDYRVLQPYVVTDPNGNRSAVVFDALSLVVGTAVMGKVGENKGDSLKDFEPDLDEATIISHIQNPFAKPNDILKKATTRLVYDLHQYQRSSGTANTLPNVVYTMARETHDANLTMGEQTKIQHSFSYSDGFSREIQKRIQAEPGDIAGVPTDPRWVGSGWVIYNNKGKPVKQYEPFFSGTHLFEFAKVGVSSTLFYDAIERVIGTFYPNHTYEKVVFNAWRQEHWDVNDTVTIADPKNDPCVSNFFRRLPDADYLPTWYESRKHGQQGVVEQVAAQKAAAHAGTPTVAHFDALGRTFLTIADNGAQGKYSTRFEFDIEGNQRAVIDAIGRVVMQYDFDMLSNRIKQTSMDTGCRWVLNDVTGKPIYSWDSRAHTIRTTYDALRRPTEIFVQEGSEPKKLVERTVYGEGQGVALNHNGRIFQRYDGAGVVTNDEYDFKGNLLNITRQIVTDYKNTLDWSTEVALGCSFTTKTEYDGLNRPVRVITPDNSVIRLKYNEANLLERLETHLRDADAVTTFVKDIDYNAKGQREFIEYGNGVQTIYEYDKLTFRLVHVQTLRGTEHLQDLFYTYDPVGNIIRIQDDADIQNVVYFRNRRVEPTANYTYDAVYRLIEASGREHLGQTESGAISPPTPTSHTDMPRVNLPHPGDGNAMGNYIEHYTYDLVGNILEMIHHGANPAHPGWRRKYAYNEPSLIQPGLVNNRLTSTTVGDVTEPYTYDEHGNIIRMPHLSLMRWDYRDQLQATSKQRVSNGNTPEITYYVYDSSGQRVRKVTERQATTGQTPTRKEERIYLGNFEIYRKYNADGNTMTLERETLHIMDDTRRIALVDSRTQGNDGSPKQVIRYQFINHIGSANLELDGEGNIISYEEYYPYGSTSYQAVRKDVEVSLKRYRYTGKERDEENSLYYYGARYYAPWLGRWVKGDPIGIKGGINLYAFVNDNPLAFIDQIGHQPENVIDDLLTFLHAQAGFEAGAGMPPTFNPRDASKFGTAAHAKATSVLNEMKTLAFRGAERIYSEVRVVAGEISKIGGKPGGPAGAHNLDIVVTKPGQSLNVGQKITGGVLERIGDLKYGGGTIDPKYAVHGSPLQTITGRTQATSSVVTEAAEAAKIEQTSTAVGQAAKTEQTVAKLAQAAKAEQAAATSAKTAQVGSLVSKAAPVVRVIAKPLAVAGKVLGPLGVVASGAQLVTAKTTAERVDAGIGVVSAGLMMSGNPVAIAAGGGLAAGQLIEKTLDVSDYASSAGIAVHEGLNKIGVNEKVSYVAGAVVSVASTPVAIGVAAGVKTKQAVQRAWNWIWD